MKKTLLFGLSMILLMSFALADAPTTPTTLSPDNNSVWFNDPTLTCSGSTDADGDDINYLFYNAMDTTNSTGMNVSGYSGVGSGWELGSSICNPFSMHKSNSDLLVEVDYVFNSDYWEIYLYTNIETWGGSGNARIDIDGVQIWITGQDHPWNWTTLDVSEYNDGEPHTIGFYVEGAGGASAHLRFWWHREGDALLQNSSAMTYLTNENDTCSGTQYELDDYFWSWKCQACDNNSACSNLTETRSLYKMGFEECDSGNVALNFTGRDEETEDLLIPDMTFDAAWTLESAWDALLYNFGLTGDNNYTFCLNPAGLDVNITGFVEYDSTNSSYSFPRQYYFQDAIINGDTSNEIDLFQLSDTFATPITFTALRGATTVEDVLIHVQRYDPGTGDYTLVAMGETGATGQDIIYMRMTDAWYRILAYSDGVLEFVGDPEHILSSSYTIYLTGGAGGMSDYWDNWESLDSINYNLAFNESGTNHVTLTADDESGASTAMCLKVEKWTMLDGMEELYYSCESSASITMSYEITDLDANHNAKFIAFFDGGWRMIDSEEIALTTNLSDLIGTDGIIYAMLFIGIIAFVGLWNPVASVALTMFGLIISFMMGLISVPWSALIGILIAGGIILFKIRE